MKITLEVNGVVRTWNVADDLDKALELCSVLGNEYTKYDVESVVEPEFRVGDRVNVVGYPADEDPGTITKLHGDGGVSLRWDGDARDTRYLVSTLVHV